MPLAIGLAAALLPAFASAAGPSLEGKPAPEIDLPATSAAKAVPGKAAGDHLKLSELKGKTVVLYFFPKALTGG
jgi:peroxiredoxin